jgi:hypothetical protein
LPKDLLAALFFATRNTLKRTVFDSGRHCPVLEINQPIITHYCLFQRTNSDYITNLDTEGG